MTALLRLALVIAMLAAPVGDAFAQPAAPDEPPAAYTVLVEQALRESAEGRWMEARAIFRRAQAIHPNARTLRAIGMASYELRDYVAAYGELSSALVEPRRPLTDTQRAEVETLRTQLCAFIGRYALPPPTEGEILFVDGVETPIPEGRILVLPAGRHAIELRSPVSTRRGEWTVQGGEAEPLTLREVVVTPTLGSDALPSSAAVPVPERAPWQRPTGLAMLGVGSGAIALGAVFWGLSHHDNAVVENADLRTPWTSLESTYERGRTRGVVGATLVGVGVALGAASLPVLRHRRLPGASVETRVSITGSDAKLELRW